MSQPVIMVEALSKSYRIGHKAEKYPTFRDALAGAVKAPFRRLGALAGGAAMAKSETFWALKDVSFEVQKGEVMGIIGRNGAGKSTLLKILSRITEPTSGRVRLRGRVASLLEVGTGFHPELTGRENIFMNGAILGMRRAEIKRKFDEIVAFAEVEKFLDTPVKFYSSGMYVRLAFAVAAHLEPEILIVDEVLAVGDAEFQKKCLGKMEAVSKGEGRTVLFVSHNMGAIKVLCSSALVLQSGVAEFAGDVNSAIERYSNSHANQMSTHWKRPDDSKAACLSIRGIDASLLGVQPSHQLRVDIALQSDAHHGPALIAIDILDALGGWIMQAIPTAKPFIGYAASGRTITVVIDIPPLIPGRYHVGVWAGPSLNSTFDEVRNVVEFEIVESPTPDRTIAHQTNRGYIVPSSRVTAEQISQA